MGEYLKKLGWNLSMAVPAQRCSNNIPLQVLISTWCHTMPPWGVTGMTALINKATNSLPLPFATGRSIIYACGHFKTLFSLPSKHLRL